MKSRRNFLKKLAVGAVAGPVVVIAGVDAAQKRASVVDWHKTSVKYFVDLGALPQDMDIKKWMYYYKNTGVMFLDAKQPANSYTYTPFKELS